MDERGADREPAYLLEVSRIFDSPPGAVRQALTDQGLRTQWTPADSRPIPNPAESDNGAALSWTEQPGRGSAASRDPGWARTVRLRLHDEPFGKARLEMEAGPYTMAGESEARAWWDSAFSHLDKVLEQGP